MGSVGPLSKLDFNKTQVAALVAVDFCSTILVIPICCAGWEEKADLFSQDYRLLSLSDTRISMLILWETMIAVHGNWAKTVFLASRKFPFLSINCASAQCKTKPIEGRKTHSWISVTLKVLLWQLFLEQSRIVELSHLANHSARHITQALNVVFIVGIFLVILPTHNLTNISHFL